MSLSRRFLNLIMGDQIMCGVRSLRCIDLTRQQLFRPSPPPPPPATRGGSESAAAQDSTSQTPADGTATTMEQLRLPDPTFIFEAEPEEHGCSMDCFPLADRKVLCADQSGRAFLFDGDARHLVVMPSLHKPKYRPISLFVPNANAAAVHADGCGSSIFFMERIPHHEAGNRTQISDQFEAFVCRKPTVTSFAESWRCQRLAPPPHLCLLDDECRQRRHEITAYGVVDGGSQICISFDDVGTYCLDTKSHTWSQVGKWTLPFRGRFEYVPEFKLWFGFSAGAQPHLAAADLSAMDSQPQLVGPWKELEPPEGWQEWDDPKLVNLGSGRFCIARIFQTYARKSRGIGDDDIPVLEFLVLTGVEVTPSVQDGKRSGSRNGEKELEMSTHKSLCHMANGYDIDAVF